MNKLRLAAIGDSLTQGFQSGAISKTTWSMPAMVAMSLGLSVPGDFLVPRVLGAGLPLDIERMLRDLEPNVRPAEGGALSRLVFELPAYFDQLEQYYERGPGVTPSTFRGNYHNVAIWGFALADALELSWRSCRKAIEDSEGWIEDDFLGVPSGPMYRTAQAVLNPGDRNSLRRDTQLDALERTIRERGGVDALMLWLGSNDALGTVLTLELKDMADVPADELPHDPVELLQWNLTSAPRFEADYTRICLRLSRVLRDHAPDAHVFVGNIPYVTIPPLAHGVGHFDGRYFDNYRRFFVRSDAGGAALLESLSREDVMSIERRIDGFNDVIRVNVEQRQHWHLVDVCGLLNRLAVRRNRMDATPDQPLRSILRPNHPLLALSPVPSVLMYELDELGRRRQGGLFSLDGVHPTTIGYGLIAELFLTEMQNAGIPGADPTRLPWSAVIANDTLLQAPPRLWQTLLSEAESHATFWGLLARALA
ncbi:MAG TPA: hypothetical protein VJN18_26890 [Polyangiaceae bacterium]|nr:hypothetical protein [Polyangiaceae bacterium]